MSGRLKAALLVGGIGVLIALPLLGTLALVSYTYKYRLFFLVSPAVIFVLAASVFAIIHTMLDFDPRRARLAGVITAVVTFVAFTFLAWHFINVRGVNSPWPTRLFPVMAAFVVTGWVPLLGGWFAGWLVERQMSASLTTRWSERGENRVPASNSQQRVAQRGR